MAKRPLPALTGLRFFLAMWVVIYHQVPPLEQVLGAYPAVLQGTSAILNTGYAAVTAFFVLSGFVLSYNYDLSAPLALRKFAAARFSRIYPAYLFGLLVLIPMAAYRMLSGIPLIELNLLDFFLNLFLVQTWIPEAALTWNYPGWSLSNEAFFYACFPFLGAWFWRRRRPVAWLLVLWGLSCAVPLLLAFWNQDWGQLPATARDVWPPEAGLWPNFVRYNPLLRLPEFCAGIVLAQLFVRLPPQHPLRGAGAWLYGPALVLTVIVLVTAGHIPFLLLHNGLLIPLFACLIFGLALEGGHLARWLATPGLTFLGNASYAIYILHAPLYSWLIILFRRGPHLEPSGWLWFACYLTVVIAVPSVFFRSVEEPLHRRLRKTLSA